MDVVIAGDASILKAPMFQKQGYTKAAIESRRNAGTLPVGYNRAW
ncbi:hypothetical protein [Peristeroidobacter agariperforans]|nr:hypothetical protein [Peristeroidobacter agariperforans]